MPSSRTPSPSPPSMGSGRRASRLADKSVSGCNVLVAEHCAIGASDARTAYFKQAEQLRKRCHDHMRRAADEYGEKLRVLNAQLRDGYIDADSFMAGAIEARETYEHATRFAASEYITRVRTAAAEALVTTTLVLDSNPKGV